MLMVDVSNDTSWALGKEVPFWYADAKKILLGVYDPQNRRKFRRSREIPALTLMRNNFWTAPIWRLSYNGSLIGNRGQSFKIR